MTDEDDALLDRVAERLRDEPPPWDRARVDEAVGRAIEEARDADDVDALAERLGDEPPPWDDARIDEAVASALGAAHAEVAVDALAGALREEPPPADPAPLSEAALSRARPAYLRWAAPLAIAAAVALAIGVAWGASREPAPRAPIARPTPAEAPRVRRLAGGHRVTTAPGTRIAIAEGPRVRVRLDAGEALFDVVPGADFEVLAGAVTVRVTGTVFTVRRDGGAVGVEVFEGSVEVVRPEGRRALRAGGRSGDGAGALRSAAQAAARARTARAEVVAPPAPAPPIERVEASPEPAAAPAAPTPSAGRRLLAAGRYAEALALAAPRRAAPPWAMIEGDALRGLGRDEEAAAAYRRAAARGTDDERAVAGLAEARVLADRLGRPAEAREALRRSGALADGSPVAAAAARLDARLAQSR